MAADGGANVKRTWAVTHVPAANTQATISQLSGGPNTRVVCTGITVAFVAGATAPTAVTRTASLIAGATGGTTCRWQMKVGVVATAGATNGHSRFGRWVSAVGAGLTLEFDSAGGANTEQSVSMEGFFEDNSDVV